MGELVAPMIVDAHHHFWNPARIPQPWMTAEHAAIDRTFEPADLEPLLAAAGVVRTVLVQSAASHEDTDYMFELVSNVDWVGAVVAWVPLEDASESRARLRLLADQPKLRGVRELIHQKPDPHWILRPEVAEGLRALADAGLVLELPAVFPDHLGDVPELARRHPGLRLVIDHLAKPPFGSPAMARWRDELAAAAAHPTVFAKVSGLNTALGRPDWGPADVVPAIEAALESFGPSRLLFGSDWPVALLNGGYVDVVSRTADAVREVAGADATKILSGTASDLYALP
jgi:L-fuconolactonase